MKINLPFRPEFKDKILSGRKVCTSRTKKYGNVGDTFDAFGKEFILTAVGTQELDTVAMFLYYEEGFGNPREFIDCWKKIHPRKGSSPKQKVYVHWWGEK